MNILIINQPLNNRGDESAHKALIRSLVKYLTNAHIKVLFVESNQDSINQFSVAHRNVEYLNITPFIGYKSVAIIGLKYGLYFLWQLHPTTRKLLKIYKDSDWVVNAPGGICMGGFQNWFHLFYLELSKKSMKPIAYYGRSFGPFPVKTKSNRIFKKISLELLSYFSYLSIRDSKSENLAKQLKLNYFSTVDTAFLESPVVNIPDDIKSTIGEKEYIVFVPNLLIWHYAYSNISKEVIIDFYRSLYRLITQHYPKHNVVMLPQTFNYGYPNDDIYFFYEIKEAIGDDRIIIIKDIYSSDVQQAIIANADLIVGARYHSIVFAINNEVPFIALSYEHKISGMLETLGEQNSMIDISPAIISSEEGRERVVLSFSSKLTKLKKPIDARAKAKYIADKSFSSLLKEIQRTK